MVSSIPQPAAVVIEHSWWSHQASLPFLWPTFKREKVKWIDRTDFICRNRKRIREYYLTATRNKVLKQLHPFIDLFPSHLWYIWIEDVDHKKLVILRSSETQKPGKLHWFPSRKWRFPMVARPYSFCKTVTVCCLATPCSDVNDIFIGWFSAIFHVLPWAAILSYMFKPHVITRNLWCYFCFF